MDRTVTLRTILLMAAMGTVVLTGCQKVGPTGPQGSPGGASLVDPKIQPQVVLTLPTNGSSGPFDYYSLGNPSAPNFYVQFNKLMDVDYLRAHPQLVTVQGFDHPVGVGLFYYGSGSRPARTISGGSYDDLLSFTINDSLWGNHSRYEVGKSYTVTIAAGLVDINGNVLQQPYHFAYTPEPYFRVLAFSPRDHSTDVSRTEPVAITFNNPVDPSMYSRTHLIPAIPGRWKIEGRDSTTLEFIYTVLPSFGTLYTITVDGDAQDSRGHIIHTPAQSVFTTIAFTVDWTEPLYEQEGVPLLSTIRVDFTDYIDTSSVRQALSILPVVPGVFHLAFGGFFYRPLDNLIPNTQYSVTISTSLRSIDGIPLSAPYTFSFHTGRFSVDYVWPSDGQLAIDRSTMGEIYFNGAIDTGSVRTAFHISPDAPEVLTIDVTGFNFKPANMYEALTTYTVTIDSTVRLTSGYTLGTPYVFTFMTGR